VLGLDFPIDGFGLIHGDLNGGNIHVSSSGDATIFDFDHFGYGWRAYDLTSFYRGPDSSAEQQERANAFFEGYETVRPLTEAERASLPAFAACRELWDTGDMLRAAAWYGDSWAGETICERTLKSVQEALKPLSW
jgi:Ser/Thr protein kinase RdoA (MazF antagonist)